MVISFAEDDAFEHLKEHGFVVTFREQRRENSDCDTWVNRGRGKQKEFDVHITELCRQELGPNGYPKGNYNPMFQLQSASGFGDLDRWIGAIHRVNNEMPSEGWLYLVSKKD